MVEDQVVQEANEQEDEKENEQSGATWNRQDTINLLSVFFIVFLVGILGYIGAAGILMEVITENKYYTFFLSLKGTDPEAFKAYRISTGVIYGAITF